MNISPLLVYKIGRAYAKAAKLHMLTKFCTMIMSYKVSFRYKRILSNFEIVFQS